MSGFTRGSRIRDILDAHPDRGRQLLFQHGFDVGEGFVDVLSQYQTIETAARAGRLRDVDDLLAVLNAKRSSSRGR